MKKIIASVIIFGYFISGCTDTKSRSKGVYLLLDTPPATHALELKKAQSILNYLLAALHPGDTLAIARIDTGSFSEKDIIAKVTFNERPSVTNDQKRAILRKMETFVNSVKGSPYADISGGVLQAIDNLNETNSGIKYILIYSDLKQKPAKGHGRQVSFQLEDFNVIAFDVTKLRQNIRDPKTYMARAENWRVKVENGGGKWRVLNDFERLDNIFTN
jgi:hypothetical protein